MRSSKTSSASDRARACRLWLCLAAALLVVGPAQAADAASADAMNQFIAYRTIIEAENKSFLEFLKMTVGGAVLLAGAFIGFMNWRTSDGVRKAAEAQLATTVEAQLARAVTKALDAREAVIQSEISAQIEASIAEQRANVSKAFDDLNAELEKRREYTDKWLYTLSQVQTSPAPEGGAQTSGTPPPAPTGEDDLSGAHILWVDDNPENNVEQSRTLRLLGATVESVLSTAAAMDRLSDPSRYRAIISDMGRRGEGEKAGIDFLRQLRAKGITLPVVVFCGGRTLRQHGDEAIDSGAYAVTSTNSALFRAVSHAVHGDQPMGVLVA